ncbi:hypothetical protein FB45DRAFT_224330 [Roridomyces roridus]|uniref:Short chain dehydrogenase n=1 Tax=Roridomyces roridus TaxID=1738132 RepID=A0AAD7BD59_9AGAR|nr:hypothetical protein FB45DRAFT_224330 [Roridomyces roridus]
MSATDKIVLITGANKGIGLEIAKQLALLKGHHVLLGSRDAERGVKAAESLGLPNVEPLTIDVSSDESIASAAETVKSKYGRLDILINNAGVALEGFLNAPTTRTLFRDTFEINVFGAAATTEAFVPLLENSISPAPSIIFVSSDLGSLAYRADPQGPFKDVHFPVYRTSKAAMNMLALTFAQRFREKGWKVNIHNPGYTATEFNDFRGTGTVEDAAKGAVRLALLGPDGETGTYSEKEGVIPW